MTEKNLQLERTVFFCDAVVAIAITLLAFNIKLEHTSTGHLSFRDLKGEWTVFAAFLLSFFNIANFWKSHHTFFVYIGKIDEHLLWYNILWLLSIVLLPFSTTLVSVYFFDTPAMFTYSLNTLMITIFQNLIWDYPTNRPGYLKPGTAGTPIVFLLRLYCNLDMINAVLAIVVSFFNPLIAFILLFTKLPMIVIATLFYRKRFRSAKEQRDNGS